MISTVKEFLYSYIIRVAFFSLDNLLRLITWGRVYPSLFWKPEATQAAELAARLLKPGCKHYARKCMLKCPECKEFFICRLCHDEVKFNEETDPKKNH